MKYRILSLFVANLFTTSLLAPAAIADTLDVHIGQSGMDDAETRNVIDDEGKIYRLAATTSVDQGLFFRLELRQDSAEQQYESYMGSYAGSGGAVSLFEVDAQRYEVQRRMALLGVGERWLWTPNLRFGFELGLSRIEVENTQRDGVIAEIEDDNNPGETVFVQTDLDIETSQSSPYAGIELLHRVGAFEWSVDGMYFHEMPPIARFEAGNEVDSESWYGANLLYHFGDGGPALGFRFERAGEIDNTSLFMRFEL
jgi:hypothetical protein